MTGGGSDRITRHSEVGWMTAKAAIKGRKDGSSTGGTNWQVASE